MRGTFRQGDILLIAPATLEEIELGDVIFFRRHRNRRSILVTHRVINRTADGLVSKGDNNQAPDQDLVCHEDLVGRVCSVQRNGTTQPVLRGWRGRVWAFMLRAWRHIAPLASWPYRKIRNSGLVRIMWRPNIGQIQLRTEEGMVVKYIHARRTVACWHPGAGRFWCRKPYDLVLPRPVRRY